jgi:hypothetical protein
MLVDSLQSLIFRWEYQVELDEPDPGLPCYDEEIVDNDELIQGFIVGDTNDFDFDPTDAYTYKSSFCLFERSAWYGGLEFIDIGEGKDLV